MAVRGSPMVARAARRWTEGMTTRTVLLTLSGLATGLQAGLYFAFAVGVMPGLTRVDDRAFVATMTRINVVIVNPIFLATFFGAPLLAVLVAALGRGAAPRGLLIAAAVLAVATFLVTVAVNVPLNDALAAHGEGAEALARARSDFEGPWTAWNIVRTLTSTASLGLLLAALGRASA